MKKESKGQQVKTFKHSIPMPDLKLEEIVGKVYFQADGGMFCIYLPEHIARVAESLPPLDSVYDARGSRRHHGTVTGPTIDPVISGYKSTLAAYEIFLRTMKREKVIGINFKHNIRHIPGFHDARKIHSGRYGDTISFVGNPAIHLKYAILWRVGDKLYRLHHEGREDEYMDYYSGGDAPYVIPWTQEREDFFAQIVGNIERLIMAMIEFFDDVEGNTMKAIANGGQLQLPPAPPRKGDRP